MSSALALLLRGDATTDCVRQSKQHEHYLVKDLGRLSPVINGWTLVRFVHVLSAAIWVGGLIVFTVVVEPKTRRDDEISADAGNDLIARIGKTVGVVIMAVLLPVQILTGVALLAHRHVSASTLLSGSYGRILFVKLLLVVVVVVAAGLHGFAAASGRRTLSRSLSMSTLVVSVLILFLAVALVP